MQQITVTILFILWILLSIILCLSLVGIIIFSFDDDNGDIYWFEIGSELLNKIIE